MGPKCPKWVQKGSKTGPQRGQKGAQRGGVPKWVPQRSEPKKSRKIFFLWPHYGGLYRAPPSKKRDSGKIPGTPTTLSPNHGKKCWVFPHAEGPAGGNSPLFFSKIGDCMVWLPGILLKNWSKRGVTPPIRAMWSLLFSINLAQKRGLYLAGPLLGPKNSARKRGLH